MSPIQVWFFDPKIRFYALLVGQNFHICLRSGPGGADPHPPNGQPDGRISVVSFTTPLKVRSKKRSLTFFEEAYF